MQNLETRKTELETSIAVLEAKLRDLRARLRDLEQERQHEAISHLDEYVKEVDSVYADMKVLWTAVRHEVQDMLQQGQD